MESHAELLKANDFVCCFKSCDVLNFYNGVSNARLLHIPLTNSCTTKGKYKARGSTIRKKGDDDRENKSSLLMMVVLKRVIFFTNINWGVNCRLFLQLIFSY